MSDLLLQKNSTATGEIIVAVAPWQSCIAVCSKCARKLDLMDDDKTKLRGALKAMIAERGLKERVRAVDISCMDVCPEGKLTIAHFKPQGIEITVVEPATAATAILTNFGFG